LPIDLCRIAEASNAVIAMIAAVTPQRGREGWPAKDFGGGTGGKEQARGV